MRGFVAPEEAPEEAPEAPEEAPEAPEEAPEAPEAPPEMVALVEETAGRTTDELPEAPSVDEITECVEPETAQEKLRRDLQTILNKHQDSDGEEEGEEGGWAYDSEGDGEDALVQEDYI
jgi:3-oxoacyl-ACP reductase-like protein